jgi:hypothetical protein
VLLGWGIGLALNAWDVFFRRPLVERGRVGLNIGNHRVEVRCSPS